MTAAFDTGLGRNLRAPPMQNEPELGQGFTLSSSRPSQSIPELILRLVRSCILITYIIYIIVSYFVTAEITYVNYNKFKLILLIIYMCV